MLVNIYPFSAFDYCLVGRHVIFYEAPIKFLCPFVSMPVGIFPQDEDGDVYRE